MFAKSGEITAPCGVPTSVSDHSPSSDTPAFNHFWMVLVQNRIGIGHHGRDATICASGRALAQEIIVLNVRWYVTYKLSYRDLVAMMGERGIDVAHTTILRWVQHYTPEFHKRWNRFTRTVGGSWRMDETYVRVKGQWTYLY